MSYPSDAFQDDTPRPTTEFYRPPLPAQNIQITVERPWLVKAHYFLAPDEVRKLVLPYSGEISRVRYHRVEPAQPQSVLFSRDFLSKFIGGSFTQAYTKVTWHPQLVYRLDDYYVAAPQDQPHFPKVRGDPGALLVVGDRPHVPWGSYQGAGQKGMNCFVKKTTIAHEYIGHYVFHHRFRQLTKSEFQKHIPKETLDNWARHIDESKWGLVMKNRLESVDIRLKDDDTQFEPDTTKTAKELFDKGRPHAKLRFYWLYMEYVGFDQGLYKALCDKGREVDWTIREANVTPPPVSQGFIVSPRPPALRRLPLAPGQHPRESSSTRYGNTRSQPPMMMEALQEVPSTKTETSPPDKSTALETSDRERNVLEEETKVETESEDLEEQLMKESHPKKKARFSNPSQQSGPSDARKRLQS